MSKTLKQIENDALRAIQALTTARTGGTNIDTLRRIRRAFDGVSDDLAVFAASLPKVPRADDQCNVCDGSGVTMCGYSNCIWCDGSGKKKTKGDTP